MAPVIEAEASLIAFGRRLLRGEANRAEMRSLKDQFARHNSRQQSACAIAGGTLKGVMLSPVTCYPTSDSGRVIQLIL